MPHDHNGVGVQAKLVTAVCHSRVLSPGVEDARRAAHKSHTLLGHEQILGKTEDTLPPLSIPIPTFRMIAART
jgi:hypothetical protein